MSKGSLFTDDDDDGDDNDDDDENDDDDDDYADDENDDEVEETCGLLLVRNCNLFCREWEMLYLCSCPSTPFFK